ncbi:MAG: hydrogenase subunit MbhD domain-containing protein [Methanomicrobiaceae archaeon]|nr:hydrogenase subunit MbhD domain-containing protein [Methanomicrobiaceae archaeon]
MIWVLDVALLLFMVCCAIAAITVKDLVHATIILAGYSLIMTVLWVLMNAVDVAFTEATVGAGITTVLFIAAIARTRRSSSD